MTNEAPDNGPNPHFASNVRERLFSKWGTDKLNQELFGEAADAAEVKEDAKDPHSRKPAYYTQRRPEIARKMCVEFVAVMNKVTQDGLRAGYIAAAKADYLKVWNAQPWWWRKFHWKLKPSHNGVDG